MTCGIIVTKADAVLLTLSCSVLLETSNLSAIDLKLSRLPVQNYGNK
jgi:hypothetical protein